MIEGETPSLVFEMSRSSVKLLFLVTEVCFPGNGRALFLIFSENEEVSNELELLARNRQSYTCQKKSGNRTYEILQQFDTSKLMTGNSLSNETGVKVIHLHAYF